MSIILIVQNVDLMMLGKHGSGALNMGAGSAITHSSGKLDEIEKYAKNYAFTLIKFGYPLGVNAYVKIYQYYKQKACYFAEYDPNCFDMQFDIYPELKTLAFGSLIRQYDVAIPADFHLPIGELLGVTGFMLVAIQHPTNVVHRSREVYGPDMWTSTGYLASWQNRAAISIPNKEEYISTKVFDQLKICDIKLACDTFVELPDPYYADEILIPPGLSLYDGWDAQMLLMNRNVQLAVTPVWDECNSFSIARLFCGK